MFADLLERKRTHFVLWRPGATKPAPTLYIGPRPIAPGSPLIKFRQLPLQPSPAFPDLWEIAATDCGLESGQVYYYWFKVGNTDPYEKANQVMFCTDPLAWTVDRRFNAPTPTEAGGTASLDPASVVLYRDGELIACDPNGKTVDWSSDRPDDSLASNNRLVIYELPTRWSKIKSDGKIEVCCGTFRDVLALIETEADAPTFPQVNALKHRSHLQELGVNALELLPPADSDDDLNWGYGTANYFAADYHLGLPDGKTAPTATVDLASLIQACHRNGYRFFVDAVMAFARNQPYRNINFADFFVKWGSNDPEQGDRDGFGGDLFKYNHWVEGYHPLTGEKAKFVPAREFMKAYAAHWLAFYHADGLRLDSVNNINNYDFLEEFKDFARQCWQQRGGKSDRFLVVGEDLSVPLEIVHQQRLDGLWNESFKQIIRQVILGRPWNQDTDFEWSIRKLIDCRNLGFGDGTQAINYLTSHDVGGYQNERFFDYLANNGVWDSEHRIKLAFVCLLTAVGIPMILAGDEFADQQDIPITEEQSDRKQVDPVNYSRLNDDWRRRIFDYVANLVRFRINSEALAVNDTKFIHVDLTHGKRIMAWQRGYGDKLVVVVANFSDYYIPEYRVHNWPYTPIDREWKEVTQDRIIPPEWIGREGVFPWEAKVYTLL